MTAVDGLFAHATVVMLGERGVLIEGPSGSGKSALAAALIVEAQSRRCFGRLVADDRVHLQAVHGRLVARPHPAIAGLLERRGTGLLRVPHEPAGVIHLVVRLQAAAEARGARLPDQPPRCDIAGVSLPLELLMQGDGAWGQARDVLAALGASTGGDHTANKLANSTAMHKIAPHDAARGPVAGST